MAAHPSQVDVDFGSEQETSTTSLKSPAHRFPLALGVVAPPSRAECARWYETSCPFNTGSAGDRKLPRPVRQPAAGGRCVETATPAAVPSTAAHCAADEPSLPRPSDASPVLP